MGTLFILQCICSQITLTPYLEEKVTKREVHLALHPTIKIIRKEEEERKGWTIVIAGYLQDKES